ncbi:Mad3/BUB1 homology region 1-domain-containing protein [Epithele typhae]|uniref:Mad3/BUB1 homology region 1-domain-containing protein n=1 Tax=Epithele typhae TaxID=378194 RepID=UPI002007AF9D|nr:Mad3/BUB1 homology region 1-domain-containing protein [Epithele typhae]KAH9945456.1 Mad3/BUB1 homology region 1-domain-containing protein [Epithele typhae]
MDPKLSAKLFRQREKYRADLVTALVEDADPLAAYDSFIKWTAENYGEHLAASGLLELLEEATRYFVADDAYKSDLRYLKLWLLYASHVEDPTVIYAFVLSKDIGKIYAQTYWEYADALERKGKRPDADAVYQKGLKRRARPVDPLKRRYEEFKTRTSPPPPKSTSTLSWEDAPPEVRALRRAPLKNHASSAAAGPSSSGPSDPLYNPYALMLAPPPPGKRKEKLRFDFSLLFTKEGQEYSMQEARARSMGLLGKKWGPPPASGRVAFSDAPGKGQKTMTRKFAGAEPTVTLATKEALADVFGMYNSPEKSMRFGPAAGSKHAPVRKIEPVTPIPMPMLRSMSNENADGASKSPFRPFVDENAQRENKTPGPAATPKIVPFVDPENADSHARPTPSGRPALSLKDPGGLPLGARNDENAAGAREKITVHIDGEAHRPSPVFTPASATFQSRQDIFGEGNVFRPPQSAGVPKILPFSDENAPRVFSLPPLKGENAPPPVFTPFFDKAENRKTPLGPTSSSRAVLGERVPVFSLPTEPEPAVYEDEPEPRQDPEPITPSTSESDADAFSQYDPEHGNDRDAFTSESSEDVDDDEGFAVYEQPDEDQFEEHIPPQGDEFDFDGDNTDGYRAAPLGGRFGQFNVMTPIVERTYEYTMSTRNHGTPGFTIHRDADAVEAAEQLAAELQEVEEEEEEEEEEVANIEERTGTLSLADALGVASSFKPPNPCNPFDPTILSTLLSMIPTESGFHDLRINDANQLDVLQKFAKKKTRRASGNSTSNIERLEIQIHDRRFAVVDKLGEGGFGAVFEAVDLDLKKKHSEDDDEDDEDDDDDDDDDESNRVALKVVKPRNLWEYHVLRRIHNALPTELRRSIISPQALYAFRDESFLVLALRKQGTLLEIVNRAASAGVSQHGGSLDELLVVFFTIELLRALDGLHRAGLVHGDVKIDNCLLRLDDVPGPASAWTAVYDPTGGGGWSHKGVALIDFGRTVDTRLFPAGQRFVGDWPTDARDCPELRDGRPWTFEPDYFGLAGVVFCMLHGRYIDDAALAAAPEDGGRRLKLATPFKRYWQGELWTRLFDVLLNPGLARPDGRLPVADELAVIRGELEAWLVANCNRASNSLKGLLKKVSLAVLGGKDAR